MEIVLFFIVAGVAVLILLTKFEKKQTVKINTILRESRATPPLFMLKSTEQKIKSLKDMLRYDDVPQNMAKAGTMADIYSIDKEDTRQSKVKEFKALTAKYNNGELSIEAYNVELDELLIRVQKHSFVLAS